MLSVNFVTSSRNVVKKILRKFYPADRVEEMVKKGDIREDIYKKGFNFSPPPSDSVSFIEFLDELEAQEEIKQLAINDTGSSNVEWRKYKVL